MSWIFSWWKTDQSNLNPGAAPDRAQRKVCWEARDAYFACLDKQSILKPGDEPSNVCSKEKKSYEANCARSWIDYFNKRRVLEEEQKDQLKQAEAQQAAKNKK